MAALRRLLPGRRGRLLLTCLGFLMLVSTCNLPQPPIPTHL